MNRCNTCLLLDITRRRHSNPFPLCQLTRQTYASGMRQKIWKFFTPALVADILLSVAFAIAVADVIRHPDSDD